MVNPGLVSLNAAQALEEEARADQQNETQGDLRHYEGGTGEGAPAAADDCAGVGFQRGREIDAAGVHGGNEPEEQGGKQADAGAEGEDAPIDFTGQGHGEAAARRQ